MALWQGSNFQSTISAMAFNNIYRTKALPIIRKKNGLLYFILGKEETLGNEKADQGPKFERSQKTSGVNVEITLMGALRDAQSGSQLQAVSQGAAEVAVLTSVDYSSTIFGAAEFPLSLWANKRGIPYSEMKKIQGNEAKTRDYIGQVFENLMLTMESVIGNGINSTNNATATTIGGWQYAVSDGGANGSLSGESGYSSYGNIDRGTGNTTDLGGVVNYSKGGAAIGTLRLRDIAQNRNHCAVNGGNVKLGVSGELVYNVIEELIDPYAHVTYDETLSQYGGEFIQYKGINFILDQRCSAGVLGLLDPTSWVYFHDDNNFTKSGIVDDPTLVASYSINWGFWGQLICQAPSWNGKLTGITG